MYTSETELQDNKREEQCIAILFFISYICNFNIFCKLGPSLITNLKKNKNTEGATLHKISSSTKMYFQTVYSICHIEHLDASGLLDIFEQLKTFLKVVYNIHVANKPHHAKD